MLIRENDLPVNKIISYKKRADNHSSEVLPTALGYMLIERLRALPLAGAVLAVAQVDNLRIKLLKLAAGMRWMLSCFARYKLDLSKSMHIQREKACKKAVTVKYAG